MSRPDLAALAGMTVKSLQRYETGEREMPRKFVPMLAQILKVDPSQLVDGTATFDDAPRGGVLIPLMTPKLGAGHGDDAVDEFAGTYLLDAGDARALGWPAAKLRAARVKGASMEPLLSEGDTVVFVKEPDARDTMCVVAVDSTLYVKTVQMVDARTVRLVSENPKWLPKEYDENSGVRVIGRVVMRLSRGR